MTPEAIVAYARANEYEAVCLTDHCWDAAVPGASDWYRPQTIDHIARSLPLPDGGGVRVFFGCETEYVGGDGLALSPEGFERMDHVNIPLTHFHQVGVVRPEWVQTPAQYAHLLVERMEQLLALPLPFHKIGIAHLTHTFQKNRAEHIETLRLVDEVRVRRALDGYAARGTGIELNPGSFPDDWQSEPDVWLRLYRFAEEAGCLFYLGSDAHHPKGLGRLAELKTVCEALGLDDTRAYVVKK